MEIDFIAEKQGKKIYVQVAYLLAGEETVKRKFSVYNSVKDSYPKYVVSTDDIDFSQNGIIHKNIKDFCWTIFDFSLCKQNKSLCAKHHIVTVTTL